MKANNEDETQNLVNGIMPQLIKSGFVEALSDDALENYGILVPKANNSKVQPPTMSTKYNLNK
jgi:hypothetical protein